MVSDSDRFITTFVTIGRGYWSIDVLGTLDECNIKGIYILHQITEVSQKSW